MSKQELAKALTGVLADTFVVYFKTHSFHWNVTGPRFKSLHELFEEQYTEMWEALDEIAERVRTLGEFAPLNQAELMKHATMQESGQMPDADGMCQALAEDNMTLAEKLAEVMKKAQDIGDEVTGDLMVQRIQAHEKNAWMLNSSREK